MLQNMNSEVRGSDVSKGARGGDEAPSVDNGTKSMKAIEKIFQA